MIRIFGLGSHVAGMEFGELRHRSYRCSHLSVILTGGPLVCLRCFITGLLVLPLMVATLCMAAMYCVFISATAHLIRLTLLMVEDEEPLNWGSTFPSWSPSVANSD